MAESNQPDCNRLDTDKIIRYTSKPYCPEKRRKNKMKPHCRDNPISEAIILTNKRKQSIRVSKQGIMRRIYFAKIVRKLEMEMGIILPVTDNEMFSFSFSIIL